MDTQGLFRYRGIKTRHGVGYQVFFRGLVHKIHGRKTGAKGGVGPVVAGGGVHASSVTRAAKTGAWRAQLITGG